MRAESREGRETRSDMLPSLLDPNLNSSLFQLSTKQNETKQKQGRVRVALNDANRARRDWEAATGEGAAAATEWANAVLQEA